MTTTSALPIGTRVRVTSSLTSHIPAGVFGAVSTVPFDGVSHYATHMTPVPCVRVRTDAGSYFAYAVSELDVVTGVSL